MDQVLKKAGRIPEQILGKVSIAVSGGTGVALPHPGLSRRDRGMFPEFSEFFLNFSVSFFNIFVLWALG